MYYHIRCLAPVDALGSAALDADSVAKRMAIAGCAGERHRV